MSASPVVDQIDAATTHAHLVLRQMGARLGRPTIVVDTEVSGPIGDRLRAWVACTEAHKMCPHLASPTVVMGMIHRPGLVWCPRCVVAAMRADSDARPDTCDGWLAGGVTTFREFTVQAGPVLLWGNVCPACSTAAGVRS